MSKIDLTKYGITDVKEILHNPRKDSRVTRKARLLNSAPSM